MSLRVCECNMLLSKHITSFARLGQVSMKSIGPRLLALDIKQNNPYPTFSMDTMTGMDHRSRNVMGSSVQYLIIELCNYRHGYKYEYSPREIPCFFPSKIIRDWGAIWFLCRLNFYGYKSRSESFLRHRTSQVTLHNFEFWKKISEVTTASWCQSGKVISI